LFLLLVFWVCVFIWLLCFRVCDKYASI
jgi:hypothetical protein